MTTNNVLLCSLDTPQGGKLKSPGGGLSQNAAEFAAIFGGWIQALAGEGQVKDEEQEKGSDTLLTQIEALQANMGLFQMASGFPLSQVAEGADDPAFLTTVPAGKEANSGFEASRMLLDILTQGDVKSTWMALSSEGGPLNSSELDQYKVQISYLLEQLSGTIDSDSPVQLSEILKQVREQGSLLQVLTSLNTKGTENTDGAETIKGLADFHESGDIQKSGNTQGYENIRSKSMNGYADSVFQAIDRENSGSDQVTHERAGQSSAQGKTEQGFFSVPTNGEESEEPADLRFSTGTSAEEHNPRITLRGNLNLNSEQGDQDRDGFRSTGGFQSKRSEEVLNENQHSGIFAESLDNRQVSRSSNGVFNNTLILNQGTPVWEQVYAGLRMGMNEKAPLKNLTIQLHPAELGSIKIALLWDNGVLHLNCTASHSTTGQVLQDKMADLRQSLEGMGIACGNMETALSDQNQSRQHEQRYETVYRSDNETVEDQEAYEQADQAAQTDSDDYLINISV